MTEEFISREAALKYIKSEQCRTCSDIGLCGNCAVLVAVKLLEKVPAADVAEVAHGRWLEEKRQTLLPVEYDDAGEPILHDYVVYRCDRCGRICKQKEPYCIMAWCWLAERFGHWWIALFAIFTMIHYSHSKKSDGGGDESAPD